MLLHHDVGLAEVAAVIESDPALTAAVLRAANSAESSPVMTVATAADGIVRLGACVARSLVIAVMLRQQGFNLDRSRIVLDEMWKHVVATGLIADGAMRSRSAQDQAPAFTAGLMHDLGRLAMAGQQARHYARVVRLIGEGESPRDAERRVFGLDHVEFGVEVGRAWSLPPELVQAVAEHHEEATTDLSRHVQTGRRIAYGLGIGGGLVEPDAPGIEAGSPDALVVASMGGQKQIAAHIAWFRGAVA